jgi:hypothetical protein
MGLLWSSLAWAGPIDNVVNTGPSSSQSPYLLPVNPNWRSTSIISVGDSMNTKSDGTPYRMVGIPDGLGAYDNGNGTFTVLMNHEIAGGAGVARAHGAAGAFVSKWTVDKQTLQVLKGEDLITSTQLASGTTSFQRFCSADLPAVTAFYNAATGKGYNGLIYMNGEEVAGGRSFAHVVESGTAYEFARMGKFATENSVASPNTGDKTVVIGLNDTTPGQVYVYIGDKQTTGSPVDKAGLTNGGLYGIKVNGLVTENRAAPPAAGTRFSLESLGDVSAKTGPELLTASNAAGVTTFLRPEDGAWDPSKPNRFYFVTTDQYDQVKDGVGSQVGRSRLWRLTFADINDPTKGGTIEAVLDGTGPHQMFDNITVDAEGRVYLDEDVGNQAHNGKIWMWDPGAGLLTLLYQHDPARFGDLGRAATAPFNQDEESSGILDVTALFTNDGPSWYHPGQKVLIADVQAHYSISGELVEGGQLLLLVQQVPAPATLGLLLFGVAALAIISAGPLRRV